MEAKNKGSKNPSGIEKSYNILDFYPPDKPPLDGQKKVSELAEKFFLDDNIRVMTIEKPPGEGKSLVAASLAKAWIKKEKTQAYILATNKELQRQYEKDFTEEDLNIVMGGVEFQCSQFPDSTCGDSIARNKCQTRKDFKKHEGYCGECPYVKHQIKAVERSRFEPLCFNIHSLHAFRAKDSLQNGVPSPNSGLLIVDEAHLLESQLRSFISVSIDVKLIESVLEFDKELGGFKSEFFFSENGGAFPLNEDNLPYSILNSTQIAYLTLITEHLDSFHKRLKDLIDNQDEATLAHECSYLKHKRFDDFVDHADKIGETVDKLHSVLSSAKEGSWVADLTTSKEQSPEDEFKVKQGKDGPVTEEDLAQEAEEEGEDNTIRLRLRPIQIPSMKLESFFRPFKKIILMSGTLYPMHMEILGLSATKYMQFQTQESRIPDIKRRINIDVIDGRNVNYKNIDDSLQRFAHYIIERVVSKLPGEKGMIHVSSTKQAEFFTEYANNIALELARKEKLAFPPAIFITQSKKNPWNKVMREFKEAPRGKESIFLVAARRFEGINLPGDLARSVIMLKTPYPHIKDALITSLNKVYPGYSDVITFVAFIQGMQRAVRSPDDRALNICLDTSVIRIINTVMKMIPGGLPPYIRNIIHYPQMADWIEHWGEKV